MFIQNLNFFPLLFTMSSSTDLDYNDIVSEVCTCLLYIRTAHVYPSQLPENAWPYTQRWGQFYSADFLDDKFYGTRDRLLSTAFLETLAELWGPEGLYEHKPQ